MKFLIIGPGAMGLLFASRLKKNANQEVFLMDYKEERAFFLNKKGIIVEGIRGRYHVNIPVITKESVNFIPDVILIFVKAYDTKSVAYEIKDIIDNKSIVITLQNGVGNIEILEEILKIQIYGGITAEGATLLNVGHIKHAGSGDTVIGPSDNRLIKIKNIFNKAHFNTFITDNLEGTIWSKLLINIAINPLTAITGLKNGMLYNIDDMRHIMQESLKEAITIVQKKNIKLTYDDPIKKVYEVCKRTADNISSMLQDILNQKPTEIDFLNGVIVREGKKLGINTPVNITLTNLIHTIEKTYKERIIKK